MSLFQPWAAVLNAANSECSNCSEKHQKIFNLTSNDDQHYNCNFIKKKFKLFKVRPDELHCIRRSCMVWYWPLTSIAETKQIALTKTSNWCFWQHCDEITKTKKKQKQKKNSRLWNKANINVYVHGKDKDTTANWHSWSNLRKFSKKVGQNLKNKNFVEEIMGYIFSLLATNYDYYIHLNSSVEVH